MVKHADMYNIQEHSSGSESPKDSGVPSQQQSNSHSDQLMVAQMNSTAWMHSGMPVSNAQRYVC